MSDASTLSPAAQAAQTLAFNMKQLAQHEMEGFGGMGEGVGMQKTPDGRRIMWMAHESAPKNFTAIDVTDPRKLKFVIQTDLPHGNMRSNSLDVVGNTMVVAYQTKQFDMKPAGFDIFDISTPEKPKLISHFDASGKFSRGVHCVWFDDGETVHMASGAPDFEPTNPKDDQCYRIIDVRNPSKPVETGRWWFPGTRKGDSAPPPPRLKLDGGYRAHNTNVYKSRPDRAYVGYIDGGGFILDISNKSDIKVVSRWKNSPPFNGFVHTMMPLVSRGLCIATEECVRDNGADWPKLTWVLNIEDETNPVPLSTVPLPSPESFAKRGGRFGSHNLWENYSAETAWRSDDIILATFFNGGVRAYDVRNPYQPQEIAYFVPGTPRLSPKGAVQINDVWVDDRGIVYCQDRFTGGLYTVEWTQ
jgi:hypothetical protein